MLKARRLNLEDAFRLAGILSKYIDTDLDKEQEAIDFISAVIGKLSPSEYLDGVILLTGATEEKVKQYHAIEILTAFIKGLQENQILTLISFTKSLGL